MSWKRAGIRVPTLGLLCPLFLVAALLQAAPASAVPLDAFVCVAGNSVDCAAGAVLRGEIVESEGVVHLTLANDADARAVIARVYIESAWVEAISGTEEGGVHFIQEGSPPVLPGAQSFEIAAFASAVPAPPHNGIGPGETGWFVLTLTEGASFDDLLSDLRVGLHVIAFEGEGSASFIAEPTPEPIPEPGSLGLLLLGIVPLAWARRRRIPTL
jgi:hypothetical protein